MCAELRSKAPRSSPWEVRPARAPYVIVAGSPRSGGNTDTAVRLFMQGFSRTARAATGQQTPLADLEAHYLRASRIIPCTACNACAAASDDDSARLFGCPLTLVDDSGPLLRLLADARGLCLAAPIYFYHLPATVKALIDRLQVFWNLRATGRLPTLQRPRLCRCILLAARTRGDKLFEGSLLTLKYALAPLGIELAEPLLLTGLDAPSALEGQPEVARRVIAYGEEAGACDSP